MQHILIVYGTTDGHTAKIAAALRDTIVRDGITVDVADSAHKAPRPDGYTGVIVAASVHGGAFQKTVDDWVRAHRPALERVPTAFVAVCLGILQKDPKVQTEVAAIVNRFLSGADWNPTMTKVVAGALLYRQYGFLKRWVMRRIVAKAGGDTDTSRDYEYTDWDDLRAFAEAFAGRVLASEPPASAVVAS